MGFRSNGDDVTIKSWNTSTSQFADSDSLIETRDGSSNVIKHHVWGTRYIDELVQVTSVLTTDEGGGQIGYEYSDYWVCQDSNYNVLGVVDEGAVLAERYEYTPCPGYAPRRGIISSPRARGPAWSD